MSFSQNSFDLSDMGYGLSDTAYTGLDDTAFAFSGSSTGDFMVPGSPLPLSSPGPSEITLGAQSGTNSAVPLSEISSYDLWNNPSPAGALSLSGISDPPFGVSAYNSTPYPGAAPAGGSLSSMFAGLTKFGAGIGAMIGGVAGTNQPHPTNLTVAGLPSAQAPSGTTTILLLVVVVALGLLVVRGKGE